MSVRSFVVFQDAPSDHPQSHHDSPPSTMTTDAAATLLSTLVAIEKENLHPITGQRAGPAIASEKKKRKTGALATKVVVDLSSKKHKEFKAEPKKARKPLGSAKPRNSDAKKTASKSSRSRRPSPLPPVAEEHELQRQPPRLSISQTNIDSRCYELTVSPLADVSEAYDATRAESQEADVHSQSEESAEPVVQDYFSPSMVNKPLPTTNDIPCKVDDPSQKTNDISTPERQHIYSAFTFSSPSPASERFKQAQSPPTRPRSPVSDSE